MTLLDKRNNIRGHYSALETKERKRHIDFMHELKKREEIDHTALSAECIALHGRHVDDSGMFYFTCANCGHMHST